MLPSMRTAYGTKRAGVLIVAMAALLHLPSDAHAGDLPRAFARKAPQLQIWQKGRAVTAVKHRVTLKAAPFELRLRLPRPAGGGSVGALLNASFSPTLFRRAASGKALITSVPLSPGSGMAEYPRNPRAELWTSSRGSHYLYYRDQRQHRFSTVKVQGRTILGVRRVATIVDIHGSKRHLAAGQLKGKTLYLVLVRKGKQGGTAVERWRHYLRVDFK